MKRAGIGRRDLKLGQVFTTKASEESWTPGTELDTWAGHRVKVLAREPTKEFGSWRYTYTFETIAVRRANPLVSESWKSDEEVSQ